MEHCISPILLSDAGRFLGECVDDRGNDCDAGRLRGVPWQTREDAVRSVACTDVETKRTGNLFSEIAARDPEDDAGRLLTDLPDTAAGSARPR